MELVIIALVVLLALLGAGLVYFRSRTGTTGGGKPVSTNDEVQATLREIGKSLRVQFPAAQARLDQLDSHLATVSMVVGFIHEEDARAKGIQ